MKKTRAQAGFTLLEVAMASAILLVGILMISQLTRTVLESTAPDSPQATQNGFVIDQYLRSEVALLKSYRDTTVAYVPDLPYGNGILRIRNPLTTTAIQAAGVTSLVQYDVVVELVQPGEPARPVAHTVFWKMGRSDGTRSGI